MPIEITGPNGTYNKDLALERYNHYLSSYQARYTYPFNFIVTWNTISFWRRQVNMWGKYLVEQGLLHHEQFLADKAFRFGEPLLIKQVQKATALTATDLW
jgi:hypothetical protein